MTETDDNKIVDANANKAAAPRAVRKRNKLPVNKDGTKIPQNDIRGLLIKESILSRQATIKNNITVSFR